MAGGGSKGGQQQQTTTTQLPPEVLAAAKQNMALADEASKIGYVPYQGNTAAGFTPMQKGAMNATQGALGDFNMGGWLEQAQAQAQAQASAQAAAQAKASALAQAQTQAAAQAKAQAAAKAAVVDPYTGLAMPPTLQGGVIGYSPVKQYEAAKAQIAPVQKGLIDSFVVNPKTGAAPASPLVTPTALYGTGTPSKPAPVAAAPAAKAAPTAAQEKAAKLAKERALVAAYKARNNSR